ncbi:WD40 repeat domain-containing protein [Actibacterium ureilyticum]|uniref:WD40 repeat domain-containing protein n=1 Tax=Actibacterium ureilyticum TaxID=1590614 RepID=UPI0015950739|nr:hypothetical protein [Actibacterium ureilyticum]
MTLLEHPQADGGFARTAPDIAAREWDAGANVTCLAAGRTRVHAGLGDGRVVALSPDGLRDIARHKGAVTGLCATRDAVLSCGQDGRLLSTPPGAIPQILYQADAAWITALAHQGGRVAIATAKRVLVFEDGQMIARFDDHPSTVSGLAFFADGRRLAVSRYNGVSIWSVDALAPPLTLAWAGSVTAVSVSPDGRYVAGATQDREIHVWDLVTGRDFRLGGYQRKVKGIGWTADTSYLYTTGADVLVAWGLAGDPGAIPPLEIGYSFAQTVSAVSPLGTPERLASGYSNGCILLGEVRKGAARIARQPDGAAITALGTGLGDGPLAFGTAGGRLGLLRG